MPDSLSVFVTTTVYVVNGQKRRDRFTAASTCMPVVIKDHLLVQHIAALSVFLC